MVSKLVGLSLAMVCFSSVAWASSVQSATLKDLRTVGSTSKVQKKQQYDLVIDTAANEFTCRSKLGEKVKPIDFVVGTAVEFKLSGQNGEATTPAGKHVKCGIVRVAGEPVH